MPKPPHEQHPPLGRSVLSTFQAPKAVELFEDDVVVVVKESDGPGYRAGVKGDAHPNSAKYPDHKLELIVPFPEGQKARWIYTRVKASLVGYERTGEGQIATVTKSLVSDTADAPALDALTISAKDENLANGRRELTLMTVENVFPGTEFTVEMPDPVPAEFRSLVPTRSTAFSEEGVAQPPDLDAGEITKSAKQQTEQVRRTQTTYRDTTVLPVTLTEKKTSEAFGFGGVMAVERTLDDADQTVDEGLTVVSSSVKQLPGGLTVKETEQLDGASGATLELTNGGSGYTSDPTVSFSGGGASGGAAATAHISTIVPPAVTPTTVKLSYAYNGDDKGVFHFLGALSNNGVWQNPNASGEIAVFSPFDTLEAGTFDSIVDRQPSNTYLQPRQSADFHIDLGSGRSLICNKLSYRQRADYNSPTNTFNLQGSNTGIAGSWIDLESIDVSTQKNVWTSKKITGTTAYRYFRLIIPATQFMIGELELYGTLSYTPLAGAILSSVTSVTITSPGSYATVPAVVFSGGGGVGASATAVLGSAGQIASIRINSGGSGYTSTPTMSFVGGTGSAATATATVAYGVGSATVSSGGVGYTYPPAVHFDGDGIGAQAVAEIGKKIAGVVLINPGSGYTTDPTVALLGGGGTGATAVVIRKFAITSTTVTAPGSGYTSAPTVTPSGGGGADAVFAAILGHALASGSVPSSGSGYTSDPTVSFTGDGTGAIAAVSRSFGVASAAVTAAGSGYTSAPAVILSGGGGTGATANAVLSATGTVTALTLTAAGSGYTSAPTVTLSGGGGTGATATAKLGALSAAVVAGGTGYVVGDVLTVSGGTFTTAAQLLVTAVAGGVISAVSVQTPGVYSVLPTSPVAVTGGTGTGATFTPTWQISALSITAAGSGYTSNPSASFSGGGGTGAAANATVSYTVASILITAAGSGYTTAPTVAISGGSGTGATGTTTLATAGAIAAISFSNFGSGYTVAPSVVLTGGGGTGAIVTTALNTTTSGTLARVDILNAGTGYTSAPTLTLTGGGGTGATATATLSAGGAITGVTVTNGGTGYTSSPSVTFTGGGGTGADASAVLSAYSVVTGIAITAPGSGYSVAPTISFVGGGGSGVVATAALASTGLVTILTLTSAGVYKTAPIVTISGGGGTGATGIYRLPQNWAILYETHTDAVEGIVINIEKKIVVAGTRSPGGYTEIQALDKWRSIQMVSSVDLRTLPVPETYAILHPFSLPDVLLSIEPVWSNTFETQTRQQTGFFLSQVQSSVTGDIVIHRMRGFNGMANATVVRKFYFGPPPLSSIPAPLVIQPASGTAYIISNHSQQEISRGTPGGHSHVAQSDSGGAQIRVADINNVLTGGFGSTSQSSSQVITNLDRTSEANGIGIDTTYPPFVAAEATAQASLVIDLPASCPRFVTPGSNILVNASVEKWRFGLYVQTLIYLTAPQSCATPLDWPVESASGGEEMWISF